MLYHSYDGERTERSMTSMAMAMRRFDEQEHQGRRRVRRMR